MINSAIQPHLTPGGVSFDPQDNQAVSGQTADFLAMALRTRQSQGSTLFSETSVTAAAQAQPASLEDMLRANYPGLIYHVFDASSSCWRTRNDYPHYLIYQENANTEFLENWTPDGPNPDYSASAAIRALSRIPAGKTAVVIHPKVQEQMTEDPEYAKEIMARIEAWFRFDMLRNEALMPGITARSSRCVAIGEDGNIVNAQSFSHPEITFSKSSSEFIDWWQVRIERNRYFRELSAKKRREEEWKEYGHEMYRQHSDWITASARAKAMLEEMLEGDWLSGVLGERIADVPTQNLFDLTRMLLHG
ncbi:MAG: hypothetical protein HFI89_09485 [Lachnospiraceae bacterium]|nr:hypothetical protein [Lachnospiraceae bacterium]